jgi:queuine tRNA-ribosyltransferase
MGQLAELVTHHGTVQLPAFFPDATRAVVRAVDALDLERCGIQGLIVNTFHLTNAPGVGLVKSQGGVHAFMGWGGPIISDSGGFQAMSMIRENARYGTVSDAGITFTNVDTKGRRKLRLTPEKCIQIQFDLGADVMMCLDDCPRPDADLEAVAASVQRTIQWARACREAFERQVEVRRLDAAERPRLFGIIQGGYSKRLRWECAEALIDIGFDGYGFGGWPLDLDGDLAEPTLAYTAQLMPDGLPKYALGVGSPAYVSHCAAMGYDLFDCVLPTRDARRQRLYCWADGSDPHASSFLYIGDAKYKRDPRPISDSCDCLCCSRYSRSYLHHLFQIQDALASRLATMHNLRFYAQLMEGLRERS